MSNAFPLPENLPRPEDDGLADHLIGLPLASVSLPATTGGEVNLAEIGGVVVVYCYPMTGQPGTPLPDGWDDIPGARGCTPQACDFRDNFAELSALGVQVFGLSTQKTEYQLEMAERLHLPYPVLSDSALKFSTAMGLPMFEAGGMTLTKRLTMIAEGGSAEGGSAEGGIAEGGSAEGGSAEGGSAEGGIIQAVHYPIFPSTADVGWVIDHLTQA